MFLIFVAIFARYQFFCFIAWKIEHMWAFYATLLNERRVVRICYVQKFRIYQNKFYRNKNSDIKIFICCIIYVFLYSRRAEELVTVVFHIYTYVHICTRIDTSKVIFGCGKIRGENLPYVT